jgi:hypothetical protein
VSVVVVGGGGGTHRKLSFQLLLFTFQHRFRIFQSPQLCCRLIEFQLLREIIDFTLGELGSLPLSPQGFVSGGQLSGLGFALCFLLQETGLKI